MYITVPMLQEMEQSIAPDTKAEIRVYPAGCTIRIAWNNGLASVQKQVLYREIGNVSAHHRRSDGPSMEAAD